MPAMFPDGRGNHLEPKIEKTEKVSFPLDKLETIVREFLREKIRGNAKIIMGPHITETPKGLQMHVEFDAGIIGGKIVINGMIVNKGNTVGVQGLDIKARPYVRSMIEYELSNFNTEIKTYFKNQSGKSVSSIQIGESGLVVEFENSK